MARTARTSNRPTRQPLQRRLGLLAMEKASNNNTAAVQRVLEVLSEENLTLLAAGANAIDRITAECGVIGKAWEDPRIANRVNQLARQNITVQRETVSIQFGDAALTRERIVIHF